MKFEKKIIMSGTNGERIEKIIATFCGELIFESISELRIFVIFYKMISVFDKT